MTEEIQGRVEREGAGVQVGGLIQHKEEFRVEELGIEGLCKERCGWKELVAV